MQPLLNYSVTLPLLGLLVLYSAKITKTFKIQHWLLIVTISLATFCWGVVIRTKEPLGLTIYPWPFFLAGIFSNVWWGLQRKKFPMLTWIFPEVHAGSLTATTMGALLIIDIYISYKFGFTVGGAGHRDGLVLYTGVFFILFLIMSFFKVAYLGLIDPPSLKMRCAEKPQLKNSRSKKGLTLEKESQTNKKEKDFEKFKKQSRKLLFTWLKIETSPIWRTKKSS